MGKTLSRKTIADFPRQSVIKTGILGRCPRCGQGKLYQSLLKPVDECGVCGLDMSFAEEGDGPAVLVILLLGGVITAFALILENLVHPPAWLHFALWIPATIVASVFALRAVKGIMIAAKYQTLDGNEPNANSNKGE